MDLTDAQRARIAPLAESFNKWMKSLIQMVVGAYPQSTKAIGVMESAVTIVIATRPTAVLEHFARNTIQFHQLAETNPDEFYTWACPQIRYLSALDAPKLWRTADETVKATFHLHVSTLVRMCRDMWNTLELPSVAQRFPIPSPEKVMETIRIEKEKNMESIISSVMNMNLGDAMREAQASSASEVGASALSLALANLNMGEVVSKAREAGDMGLGQVMSSLNQLFTVRPEGFSHEEIMEQLGSASDLLTQFGIAPNDQLHGLVGILKEVIMEVQAKTGNSPVNAGTAEEKIKLLTTSILQRNDLGDLMSVAMESPFVQKMMGTHLGVPMAELVKNPFGGESSGNNKTKTRTQRRREARRKALTNARANRAQPQRRHCSDDSDDGNNNSAV